MDLTAGRMEFGGSRSEGRRFWVGLPLHSNTPVLKSDVLANWFDSSTWDVAAALESDVLANWLGEAALDVVLGFDAGHFD